MTAAVVALALTLAGSVVAIVWIARQYVAARNEARSATDLMHADRRLNDEALARVVEERDVLTLRLDVATQTVAATKTRLAIAESQRNRAQLEERERVIETIRAAGPVESAALVNRILQAGPNLPKASPTGSGNGDR